MTLPLEGQCHNKIAYLTLTHGRVVLQRNLNVEVVMGFEVEQNTSAEYLNYE
jgi:hypothetical protein